MGKLSRRNDSAATSPAWLVIKYCEFSELMIHSSPSSASDGVDEPHSRGGARVVIPLGGGDDQDKEGDQEGEDGEGIKRVSAVPDQARLSQANFQGKDRSTCGCI